MQESLVHFDAVPRAEGHVQGPDPELVDRVGPQVEGDVDAALPQGHQPPVGRAEQAEEPRGPVAERAVGGVEVGGVRPGRGEARPDLRDRAEVVGQVLLDVGQQRVKHREDRDGDPRDRDQLRRRRLLLLSALLLLLPRERGGRLPQVPGGRDAQP